MTLTFEQMLVIWNLKGAVRDASSEYNTHPDFKKIKVRLDPKHTVFIRYNKAGPLGLSLYFDDGHDFKMIERIGIAKTVPPEILVDELKMWMKDVA